MSTLTTARAVAGSQRASSARSSATLAAAPLARRDGGERGLRPRAASGGSPVGLDSPPTRAGRPPPCPGPRTGRRPRPGSRGVAPVRAAASAASSLDDIRERSPAEPGRARVVLRERPARQERDRGGRARSRAASAGTPATVATLAVVLRVAAMASAISLHCAHDRRCVAVRRATRSSGTGRDAGIASAVDAPHATLTGAGTRPSIEGASIELRRHRPANLPTVLRWYADPELARLTRYSMRPDAPRRGRAVLPVAPAVHASPWPTASTSRPAAGSSA